MRKSQTLCKFHQPGIVRSTKENSWLGSRVSGPLTQPVLPLASAAASPTVDGSADTSLSLRALDKVASEPAVFKLERLFRLFVFDGAVVLHFVAVKVLFGWVTAVTVDGDSDWVREGAWPLKHVRCA